MIKAIVPQYLNSIAELTMRCVALFGHLNCSSVSDADFYNYSVNICYTLFADS